MPKFLVKARRIRVFYVSFEIEAEDSEQAWDVAEIGADKISDEVWADDETLHDDIEIMDVVDA